MVSYPVADSALMQRLKTGDSGALGPLVHRYQAPLLNAAYKILGGREPAEDAVQQTFVNVIRSAGKYQPTASVKTWLYTILINLCRDKLRESARRPTVSLDEPTSPEQAFERSASIADLSQPEPSQSAEMEERNRLLRSALASLPETQRDALVLKEFGRLSYREIAEIVGVTDKAVDSLLSRGRESLRKNILPYFRSEGF